MEQTDTTTTAPETQEPSDNTTPPNQEATPTSEGAESENKPAAEKPPEAKKPKKPTVRSVDLPIAEQTASLSKKELDNMREKEVWLGGVAVGMISLFVSRCN